MADGRTWIAIIAITILILNIVGFVVLRYSWMVFWTIIIAAGAVAYYFRQHPRDHEEDT